MSKVNAEYEDDDSLVDLSKVRLDTTRLIIVRCKNLKDIKGLFKLVNLQSFYIRNYNESIDWCVFKSNEF